MTLNMIFVFTHAFVFNLSLHLRVYFALSELNVCNYFYMCVFELVYGDIAYVWNRYKQNDLN